MPTKKKNSESIDFAESAGEPIPETSPPPVARQKHTVVTTYQKMVPLQEIEAAPAEEEEQLVEYFAPPVEIPTENADPIAEMFRDLQIERRSHSWTMVIERLVNFEKDGRFDAGSKRVNCGTRPVTPDFVEEIRREFARPGRSNHFRVLIKRDGKIFAHWPEALSLEPPPVEEILAEDARHAGSAPAVFPVAADPSKQFKQMLDQMRQLAELRAVLFPDQPAAAPVQNPAPLTEEAALLKLLAADSDVVDRVSRQISKRLFSSNPEPETSWPAVLAAGLQYLPTILQQLGFRPPETAPAPAGPQLVPPREISAPPLSPAPPAADQPPPVENGPTPELALLGRVLQYCADQVPPEGAAAWVDGFCQQNPTVAPLVDLFLAMSPADCLAFLRSYFPAAAGIIEAPHAPTWIQRLQAALTAEPEQSGEVAS